MKQTLLTLLGILFCSLSSYAQLNIMWESRFDNDNKDDISKGIVIDNSGNSYVVGTSKNGANFEVVTIKYDPNGIELWNVSTPAPGFGPSQAVGIVLDSNNDPIIGGYYFIGGNDYDIFARKLLTIDGSTEWTYSYTGSSNYDELKDITIDGNDNVILVGGIQVSGTDSRFEVISLNSAGTENWVRNYNPSSGRDFANAVTVDALNNVYVTGESNHASTKLDFYTIKYDALGAVKWQLRTDGIGLADRASSIAVAYDGSVYVGGSSYRGLLKDDDIMLVKISATGTFLWNAIIFGTEGSDDKVKSLAVDNDNHVYLVGSIKNIGNGEDFYAARYRPDGTMHWDYLYQSPTNGFDIANRVRISSDFNIYVAGFSNVTATSDDYLSVKLDTLGSVKWIKKFNGPASKSDQMSDFQIDIDGNLFMTGSSTGTGTLRDFSTIKYCQLETIASENDTICIGESVQLGVTGGMNFQWAAIAGDTVNLGNLTCFACDDPIVTPSMTTTYVVSSESASGCIDFDTVIVVVNPLPGPAITSSGPTSFCEGGSVSLTADAASVYNWSTGESTQTIMSEVTGTFSLTVTDSMGCQNSTSISVEVYPIPEVVGGSDSFVCHGDSIQLNATGAHTYVWHTIPTYFDTLSNGEFFKPSTAISLVVFGESLEGCLGKDTISLAMLPYAEQIQISQGFNGYLFVNFNQGTNYWSFDGVDTGLTGPAFYFDTVVYCNGLYEVVYEDSNGCKTYASYTVSGETSCLEIPEDTSNVKTNEMTQLLLYPNPTRGEVMVSFENIEVRTISIYSMQGVLVRRLTSQEKEIVLDLSEFVNGTYMVTVQGDGSFGRARVVKH